MKKTLFLVAIFLGLSVPFRGLSNPVYIPPPQVFLSEITFTSATNWSLELEIYIFPYDTSWLSPSIFDSIVIQTNSGRSRLVSFPVSEYQLFVVTYSDFNHPLTIDPVQDTIRIITYVNPNIYFFGSVVNTHMLVYGYSNCEIPTLNIGQSICERESIHGTPLYFYLDNSPTIGYENDFTGAVCSIYGHFFDCRDSLITYTLPQHQFSLPIDVEPFKFAGYDYYFFETWSPFTFDDQGFFHTELLSRNGTFNYISYMPENYCSYSDIDRLFCQPATLSIQPGGTQYLDIHLTDSSFLVGMKENAFETAKSITVLCGPNPVDQEGTFYISSGQPVEDAEIRIFSLTGKQVLQLEIPGETKSQLRFSRDQLGAGGTYLYSVLQDGLKVASGHIICR